MTETDRIRMPPAQGGRLCAIPRVTSRASTGVRQGQGVQGNNRQASVDKRYRLRNRHWRAERGSPISVIQDGDGPLPGRQYAERPRPGPWWRVWRRISLRLAKPTCLDPQKPVDHEARRSPLSRCCPISFRAPTRREWRAHAHRRKAARRHNSPTLPQPCDKRLSGQVFSDSAPAHGSTLNCRLFRNSPQTRPILAT